MFIFIQSFTLLLEQLRNKLHLEIEEKNRGKKKGGGEINDFNRGIRKFIEIRKILFMVDDCKCVWRILNPNLVFIKGTAISKYRSTDCRGSVPESRKLTTRVLNVRRILNIACVFGCHLVNVKYYKLGLIE